MGYQPPIVSLALLHAGPERLPEHAALADPDFDWLHFDVADGQFVPWLGICPYTMRHVRRHATGTFEVHLLAQAPERLVPQVRAAGADLISIHPQACAAPRDALRAIRASGAKAGVALSPDCTLERVRPLLAEADAVLVVTTSLEYDGSEFQPDMLQRVRALRELREREGLAFLIEVDGGLTLASLGSAVEAGGDVFVVGRAVFGAGDPAFTLATFRAAVRGTTLEHTPDGVSRHPAAARPRIFKTRRAA